MADTSVLAGLCADLAAEHDGLDALVAGLDEAAWDTPTPAEGWTVRDQVSHLASVDEWASTAAGDPGAFTAFVASLPSDSEAAVAAGLEPGRAMTGLGVLAWWRKARDDFLEQVGRLDPATRVPWFGPPMSPASLVTARLMETWAHGEDVAVPRPGLRGFPGPRPPTQAATGVGFLAGRKGDPMFIQVIQGTVADRQGLRRQLDRWAAELKPGATGWLGTTAGVTDDGQFIASARFESVEAARANSGRAEQGAWWAETEKCFAGPVTFQDCTDVDLLFGGGSDEAGFVQVLQGGPADRGQLRQLDEQFEATARQHRPDIMGWVRAWHADGRFTELVYFTSEADAREGEAGEPSDERKRLIEEWRGAVGDIRFFDLREPWLYS